MLTNSTRVQRSVEVPCARCGALVRKFPSRLVAHRRYFCNRACQHLGSFGARFWTKVDKTAGPTGCWLWTGSTNGRYGKIQFRGKLAFAHRVSWALATGGDISAKALGTEVMHGCDTPRCVNPAHLTMGTSQANAVDMARKGRSTAKLTPDQVIEIREWLSAGAGLLALGMLFGVHPCVISDIRAGRSYSWVA